jgi:hypothetical protein
MKWRVFASAVCFCVAAGPASAQEAADVIHVSGQADFLAAATGGAGAAEWFHRGARDGWRLGAQSGSLADAWWTYGRVGGFVERRSAVLTGTLEAGGGTDKPGSFGYQKLSGEIAAPVVKGRLLLATEGQFARIAGDASVVARLGVMWQSSRAIVASASYYWISHGGSASPSICTRLDMEHGRTNVLTGVVLTRRVSSAMLVNEISGLPRTPTEFFAGWGVRRGSYQLLIVGTVAPSPSRANHILVSVRVPLRSARSKGVAGKQTLAGGTGSFRDSR